MDYVRRTGGSQVYQNWDRENRPSPTPNYVASVHLSAIISDSSPLNYASRGDVTHEESVTENVRGGVGRKSEGVVPHIFRWAIGRVAFIHINPRIFGPQGIRCHRDGSEHDKCATTNYVGSLSLAIAGGTMGDAIYGRKECCEFHSCAMFRKM